MAKLPDQALVQVAGYFQALSEPTRLKIMNELRHGERNVGELALVCSCTLANVSKHLSLLTRHGLVSRDIRGTCVYYRFTDASIYALCDLVCDNIIRLMEKQAEVTALMRPAQKDRHTD
jgi:DNA-binding transcriptional ArsR family regulator